MIVKGLYVQIKIIFAERLKQNKDIKLATLKPIYPSFLSKHKFSVQLQTFSNTHTLHSDQSLGGLDVTVRARIKLTLGSW